MPQTHPDCDITDTFWSPATTGWAVAVMRIGMGTGTAIAAAEDAADDNGVCAVLVYSLDAVVFGDIENIVGGGM